RHRRPEVAREARGVREARRDQQVVGRGEGVGDEEVAEQWVAPEQPQQSVRVSGGPQRGGDSHELGLPWLTCRAAHRWRSRSPRRASRAFWVVMAVSFRRKSWCQPRRSPLPTYLPALLPTWSGIPCRPFERTECVN